MSISNNPDDDVSHWLSQIFPDERELAGFIDGHPLRFMCTAISTASLLRQGRFFASRVMRDTRVSESLPYSARTLEKKLKTENIKIVEEAQSPAAHPVYSEPRFISCPLAWSQNCCIYLNVGAINRLVQLAQGRINSHLSYECVRGGLLAHEWFHILFAQMPKPAVWGRFSRAECIIIEEVAARIFTVKILDREGMHQRGF